MQLGGALTARADARSHIAYFVNGGRWFAGGNAGSANKSGPGPVQSFLRNSPSVPQAFERVYGTIQTGSPTQLYVINSKVASVEKTRQPFPRAIVYTGNP